MITRLFRGAIAALAIVTALSPLSAVRAESEETSSIEFWGQLIELSSTEVPTTIVVRKDPTGTWTDYTVDIDADTDFGTKIADTTAMTDWITGDWLRVKGEINENTGVVTADVVVNTSIDLSHHRGLNGWITEIGDDSLTIQWNGVEHEVNVTSSTRMVVPPTNPAALTDFQVGDRVRLRLEKDSDNARIIVALRRGDEIFLKARTRPFSAELQDVDDNGDGTGTLTVTLAANPHLRSGDVNNLIGDEGDELTVTYDENTRFVRRFNGEATVDEFVEGDLLFVVGRVNDDGTISARLVKDSNIWMRGVARHAGEVTAIDTTNNEITVVPARSEDDSVTGIVVEYDDDTAFKKDGETVTESDVEVGDIIHVRGTAHASGGTLTIVDVETVAIVSGDDMDDEDEPEDEDEDEDEDLEEEDEDELPDLKVSDIDLDDGTIEIELENDGDVDVDETVTVYVWLDDTLTWTYSSSTLSDQGFLEAGGESTISPQSIDEDTEVKACVDYGEDVEESDEDNNCRTETLEVE